MNLKALTNIALGGAIAASCAAMAAACSAQKPVQPTLESVQPTGHRMLRDSRPLSAMPRAVVYRMTGDYADRVPITLNPDGTIANYPAPSDISANVAPIYITDGWWLDRRGVSNNTVFTRYSYAEYATLPQAPSADELLKAVIPGARVVDAHPLNMTLQQALADTAAVKASIAATLVKR